MSLPEGYSWGDFRAPIVTPAWFLIVERGAGTAQFNPSLYVNVACSPDPGGLVARISDVGSALGQTEKITVGIIGEATSATRAVEGGDPHIYFARGPFVVDVSFSEINQGDAEAVAQAVDAALVATP